MSSPSLARDALRVLAVISNKGGVGKTTVATNLAIFLRALDEDLPILVLSTDDQRIVDRMFGVAGAPPGRNLAAGWAQGRLDEVIQPGQYGVDWVPSTGDLAALRGSAESPSALRECLEATARGGLVIVDTKSDLERLTVCALHAADCVIAPVADHASLLEVEKLLSLAPHPGRVRVLQTLVDRRTRISPSGPLLARALHDEIARRGWRRFDVEISRSPRLELLNSESDRPRSVLHDARGTAVHREFRRLAAETMRALGAGEAAAPRRPAPEARGAAEGEERDLLTWFRTRYDASSR